MDKQERQERQRKELEVRNRRIERVCEYGAALVHVKLFGPGYSRRHLRRSLTQDP